MKKKLLLIVLALAILTSLTAGTLAVYTKSVSQNVTVEAKRFTFNASGSFVGNYSAFTLAPTESIEYTFAVANVNADNSAVAEVALDYDVTLNYADAKADMPGLTVVVKDGETVVGSDTDGDGVITFEASSAAGTVFKKAYSVVVTWADANDDAQTIAGTSRVSFASGLTITVVASQKTSS